MQLQQGEVCFLAGLAELVAGCLQLGLQRFELHYFPL